MVNADGSPDGGVHSLYTITGRSDAAGCSVAQPNFAAALLQNNVIFRIPTPVFGAGLIEQIPDGAILANLGANADSKSRYGIRGRGNFVPAFHATSAQPNKNGNDGRSRASDEGAEQVTARVRRRGLQRRDGHHFTEREAPMPVRDTANSVPICWARPRT